MAKNNPNKLAKILAILSNITTNLIYVGQTRLFHPRLAVGLKAPPVHHLVTPFMFNFCRFYEILFEIVEKLVSFKNEFKNSNF